MKTKDFKTSCLIIYVCLLCIVILHPVNLLAEQPSDIQETIKGQGKERPQPPRKRDVEKIGSIFDDQADEFEEPTYTPPADIEAKIKAIPPIPGNIKKHLKDKYAQIDDNRLSSTLMQTPYGPSGSIHIGGDITPKSGWNDKIKGGDKSERTRAMARAFIEEEISLFGIPDMEELKERAFETTEDTGYTHIYYQRCIGNLPIDYSDIAVHIGPDEKIKVVQGNAIAPPCPVSSSLKEDPRPREDIQDHKAGY